MKKLTVFIDKTLRQELEGSSEWSVAYRSALNFLSALIAYGSNPRMYVSDTSLSPDCYTGFSKFVCGCHHESTHTRVMFTDAHRVEACLTLRSRGWLTLELKAYRVRAKESYLEFQFFFNQKGAAGPSSYSF